MGSNRRGHAAIHGGEYPTTSHLPGTANRGDLRLDRSHRYGIEQQSDDEAAVAGSARGCRPLWCGPSAVLSSSGVTSGGWLSAPRKLASWYGWKVGAMAVPAGR